MKRGRLFELTAAASSALAVAIVGGLLIHTPRVQAKDDAPEDQDESTIQQWLNLAPVKLTYEQKNKRLVALGSYLVNAVADCNGCHSAGPPTEFALDGNPYFLPGNTPPLFFGKKTINTGTYLGGGRDFGQLGNPPAGAHIFSRNLTPDRTGMAVGGATFKEFLDIIRTGTDKDSIHPHTCAAGSDPNTCLPFPFNPAKLQVMRWPFFQDMSTQFLLAIYTYLSAVPCIAGPNNIALTNPQYSVEYPVLHNNCGN